MEQTIVDVISQSRKRWFGHVVRYQREEYFSIAYREEYHGRQPGGRAQEMVRQDQTGIRWLTTDSGVHHNYKTRSSWQLMVRKQKT